MTPLQQMLSIVGALPPLQPVPEVVFRPELLTRSHRIVCAEIDPWLTVSRRPQLILIAWSLDVFHQRANRGVIWHDEESEHCRTWSNGCRCDLGDES